MLLRHKDDTLFSGCLAWYLAAGGDSVNSCLLPNLSTWLAVGQGPELPPVTKYLLPNLLIPGWLWGNNCSPVQWLGMEGQMVFSGTAGCPHFEPNKFKADICQVLTISNYLFYFISPHTEI